MSYAKIEITLRGNANVLDVIRLLRVIKESEAIEELNFEVD